MLNPDHRDRLTSCPFDESNDGGEHSLSRMGFGHNVIL
jgi:hypothetical protein